MRLLLPTVLLTVDGKIFTKQKKAVLSVVNVGSRK